MIGHVHKLPEIFVELEIKFFLLRRLLGVKTETEQQSKVQNLAVGEVIMLNVGSTAAGGRVLSVKKNEANQQVAKISLLIPVCTQEQEKVALSRRIEKHWR